MSSTAIFIGATLKGAADGDEFFAGVKIPGNMSKPATIEAHVTKVRGDRLSHLHFPALSYAGSVLPNTDTYDNHAQRPMISVLASVCIIGLDGKVVYQQVADDPITRGKVALPLISYLKETYPLQFSDSLRLGDADPQAVIFGFNLKQILRVAAFEVLHRNTQVKVTEQLKVPVRLWHNPVGVYDPYSVLLSKDDQKDLDLYSLLRYFGVTEHTPGALSTSAEEQAKAARTLAFRAQLV